LERIPLGIYDIALLAECEQLVDVSTKTRHQLNIDVGNLRDAQLPPGIEEYDRLSNAISEQTEEGYEEAYEESPSTTDTKVERPSGPELKLFGVELGVKNRGHILTVTANLGEVKDKEPSTGVVVIEISRETAKARTLDYESIALEVTERLSNLNVNDDTINETIASAIEALRKDGIVISE
jgi:hypothetical protein